MTQIQNFNQIFYLRVTIAVSLGQRFSTVFIRIYIHLSRLILDFDLTKEEFVKCKGKNKEYYSFLVNCHRPRNRISSPTGPTTPT